MTCFAAPIELLRARRFASTEPLPPLAAGIMYYANPEYMSRLHTDPIGHQMIAGAMPQTTDSESDAGYERDVTLGGRTVHEKFTRASGHGELQIIVAKRFEVDVDGDNVDMESLHQALSQVDLGRLEGMKDAGAQN